MTESTCKGTGPYALRTAGGLWVNAYGPQAESDPVDRLTASTGRATAFDARETAEAVAARFDAAVVPHPLR
jgi:hypothetical protein